MGLDVRLNHPGLLREKNRNGTPRWRVRVEGNKAKKITLSVTPDHPQFSEHYYAARAGVQLPRPEEVKTTPNTIAWLVEQYQAAMQAMPLDPATVAYRTRHTDTLRQAYGEYQADTPTHKLIELRDTMQATPGTADTFIKSIRAMYKWGLERGRVKANPAVGVSNISGKAQGAVPWTLDDLRAYRQAHPPGSAFSS